MRVAIIHYWFMNRRGGERVVEALCELFPQADIFTLIAEPEHIGPALENHKLTTSFLQRLPGARHWYRHALPIYPMALEQFDLSDYDLVISSESGPAKGVLTNARTCHICYCHTPMRYLWDFYHDYKDASGLGPARRSLFRIATHYARLWDHASASRVDHFIANSNNVAYRIRKLYRREAEVIYPPVDVQKGYLSSTPDEYYLVVGQLVTYKRVDLAIQACNKLRRPLRIVGRGEDYKQLRRIAGNTIEFLGALTDDEIRRQYAECRALLFPGEEDFGMVPVEAQSFGRPVIAFGAGGALETVIGAYDIRVIPDAATGVFFHEQSSDALASAIQYFEALEPSFSPYFIRQHAQQFDKKHFLENMGNFVVETIKDFNEPLRRVRDRSQTVVAAHVGR